MEKSTMNPLPGIATITLNPAIDQSVAIPDFAAGSVNRVAWTQSDPGGKGVNVASFLADLGFRVAVTGLLGRDNAGVFEQLFAAKGISDAFVRIPGNTRVNVKIIDETSQRITDINFPGPAATAEDLDALGLRIDALLADNDCFVVSGSVPTGVSATFCPDLIRRLKSAGKRVLLDSSGEALRAGISAAPWAIKPNIAELEELTGAVLAGPGGGDRCSARAADEGPGLRRGVDGARRRALRHRRSMPACDPARGGGQEHGRRR
jgi:1-phosphofructokinase